MIYFILLKKRLKIKTRTEVEVAGPAATKESERVQVPIKLSSVLVSENQLNPKPNKSGIKQSCLIWIRE